MIELSLNKSTRSTRRKWVWSNRNKARAADILEVMAPLKPWWPLTVRAVLYQLLSNNAANRQHWQWNGKEIDIYDALISTLKWMRIHELIPWNAITDKHRTITSKLGFENASDFVERWIHNLFGGYKRCLAQKQDNYIEIWIEKEALLHIVKPVADDFCRRVVACKGYNSITFQADFYKRANDALGLDQRPVVLYFGDWDPSGVNMIYAAMQTLTDELGLDMVKYYRAGINPNHFELLQYDPVPVKTSDKRYKRFEMECVKAGCKIKAYELDALHPVQLQELVRISIKQFTDMAAYFQNECDEGDELELLEQLKQESVEYIQDKAVEIGL